MSRFDYIKDYLRDAYYAYDPETYKYICRVERRGQYWVAEGEKGRTRDEAVWKVILKEGQK